VTTRTALRGAACLLVPVALALPAAPPAAAAGRCPAVEAIAVPGTSQTTPQADPRTPVGILGEVLEPLKQHSRIRLTTYYTPYPATIIGGTDGGGYKASKDAGIDATNARLKTVAQHCPTTSFLLSGYSQGADVAGDVAAAIGNNRGAIPANRLLGVALVADPSQSPIGQPTLGVPTPGMGFAGVRTGGFGSLTARDGVFSICAPRDYFCNLPQGDLVMRMIGHLGSHLDSADPAGSARRLATLFMSGLIAPASAAITQILQLVSDPNLIPNLIARGVTFARALAGQLFWLAGPQVAAAASVVVNIATSVIGLIQSRAWGAIPAMIASLATHASAVATTLTRMRDQAAALNTSGFGTVGTALTRAGAGGDFSALTAAVLNAISVATGGLGLRVSGLFGPTFAQFSPATVAVALKRFAEFVAGGFHTDYDSTPLDAAGHTGTQLVTRYFANHLNRLV
jgi:hypothetical protein